MNWAILPAFYADVFGPECIGVAFSVAALLITPFQAAIAYFFGVVYDAEVLAQGTGPAGCLGARCSAAALAACAAAAGIASAVTAALTAHLCTRYETLEEN